MRTLKNKNDIRTIDVNLSNLTTRSLDDGSMQITGYGLLFNQASQPMPFIEYFDKDALDGLDLSNVLLLRSHDFNNILARADSKTLTVKVDDKGLYFSAILPDTTIGRDTYTDIQAGNLKGCSVGFKIASDDWSKNSNGQSIHEIHKLKSLTEISIVSLPAYTQTSVEVERSLEKFMKEGNQMNENDEKQQDPNSQNATDAENQQNKQPADNSSIDYDKLASLIANKLASKQTRDDSDDDSDSDDVDDEEDDAKNKSEMQPTDSDKKSDKAETAEEIPDPAEPQQETDKSEDSTDSSASAENTDNKKKEGNEMRDLNAEMNTSNTKDAFEKFLKTGEITRDLTGMSLENGQVLIPKDILPAEHEQHQFTRLGNLIRTISVKHTTGILPYFEEEDQTLSEHTEFTQTDPATAPTPKQIAWILKTYTGKYVFSQDLLSDSDYDWEQELASRLTDMRDNTDDVQIAKQLTGDVTAEKVTDLLDQIVETLDKKLKPQDSSASSIVLSQSAYAELDAMKDTMGRPLIQPDVTKATDGFIKGKAVIKLDDTLFPGAKFGDANMVITPLEKAVIKFKNNDITGQFLDTYDIWYKILGIYMRADYVQARKDLITWVSSSPKQATDSAKGNSNTGTQAGQNS